MRLVELEIGLHDWAGMPCGCGRSAEHVADDLLRIAQGRVRGASQILDGHAWMPATLYLPASAVTSVAVAALADDLSPKARGEFLEVLLSMVAGEGTSFDACARGLDLPALCQEIAAQGLWMLYREVASGSREAGAAFEVLTVVETDRTRLRRIAEQFSEVLPSDCLSGLDDDWMDGDAE